jgi:hypothetical protein
MTLKISTDIDITDWQFKLTVIAAQKVSGQSINKLRYQLSLRKGKNNA